MKLKTLLVIFLCVVLLNCGSKPDNAQALQAIKQIVQLSDQDIIEIMGISPTETKEEMLVKFKINENQVSSKMRKYDKGWQLDSVQNELGMWIPASTGLSRFDQAKKYEIAKIETMTLATVLEDYVTDHGSFPEAMRPFRAMREDEFFSKIYPLYIKDFPENDPWGGPYFIYLGKACIGTYGIKTAAAYDFIVVSWGKDKKSEDWSYDPTRPEAGLFSENDFDRDIINCNGTFIRVKK